MISCEKDFGRVYEDHVDRVYAFVAYRVADRATAEDLTHLAFERALRAWARFDPRRGSELTWLVAIARNVLADHFRRVPSRRATVDSDTVAESEYPLVAGPETVIGGSSDLVAALGQLADREREVIALRFGGDLDAGSIARLLGLSPANVHQILSRSLRRLRVILDGSHAPGGQDAPAPMLAA